MRTQVTIMGGGLSGQLLSYLEGIDRVVLERLCRAHVEGRRRCGVGYR